MPYVVVDNFSGGLDSRRHVLNSKTGTLSVLKNAHVTRGGEIEKRKAFVQYADVSETALGVETFGMEATADGIYVFGWEPAPPTMPTGIIYQQLRHPYSYPGDGIDPPTSDYPITKIVYSTVYGGKTFVIAEFGNNNVYGPALSSNRMAFYDGVAIEDWYEGFCFKDEHVIQYDLGEAATDILNRFVSYFPVGNYTATGSLFEDLPTGALEAWVLDVTGPIGKPFTLTSNIEGTYATINVDLAPTVVTTQVHKVEVPETLSKGSFSITGGAIAAANIYQTGRNLDAAALPGIRSIRVAATAASAADGIDLIGWGGATGLKYNTYTPPYTTGSNCGSLYYNIAKAINDNTTAGIAHGYSAVSYRRCQNKGNDTNDLIIYAPPSEGSTANGFLLQIEFDANPTGVTVLNEFINVATIATSPYNASKFIATYGTLSGGFFNRVNSVKVDGIEVLGTPVSWENSHGATAAAVAVQINAYTSSPEYVATTTDGSKVVLTAGSGTGKTPNGRIISVETEGTVVISGITSMSGGVDTVAAIPQITRVSFYPTGNFLYPVKAGGKYGLTIVDPDNPSVPIIVGASRVAGKSPGSTVTYKSKEYAAVGSTLYFSAVNDATKWDIYDTGSGFIDMSNNFGGREDITGMGVYQNYLAVFNRRSVQLWSMDVDPANNSQAQIIANTGALAPNSIVSVGSIDLLYLADNGVRSLRARENTDTAFSSDIGSAIDSIVISHMEELDTTNYGSLGYDTKYTAKAIIEPIDGRYWLSLGGKIYVLSYFPGSNISAWSIYETDQWDVVTEMVTREDKVYIRDEVGKIYIYGFDLNAPSIDDRNNIYDSSQVVVELPYLDGNKPATYKEAKGIDMTCAGEWKVYLGFDHTNPSARDLVATVTQPTFALGKVTATGAGTHFGPRFVNQSAGPALLANFIVHFDEMHSKHDAG